MYTIEITFKDGIVGHLDFKTESRALFILSELSAPDLMERHGAVSCVLIRPKAAAA